MKFQVKSRQPDGAFGNWNDVPESQDHTYDVSSHRVTFHGLENALANRRNEINDYRYSHGICAVQSAYIELNGKRLDINVLETMSIHDMTFHDEASFYQQYQETIRIMREVEEDLHSRW